MREASGGAEKLVAIEIRLTNSACNKGTREIRVILYAKDAPFCAPAPADELSIEAAVCGRVRSALH
jgi:hypothetical protein